MTVNEVVSRMQCHHYMLDMGRNKLARWFKCTPDEIREAKKIVRSIDEKVKSGSNPKILLIDIETAPMRSLIYRLWNNYIPYDSVTSEWFIISYSCKWLNEKEIRSNKLTHDEILNEDDFKLVLELWEYLDEANIVIAHNGKKFDIPKMKTRFLAHNLPPTSFYQQIYTLEVAKKEFAFTSNKLDSIAKFLGIPGKIETGIELWKLCMEGNEEALDMMEKYNRNDVVVLEKIYLKLRGYIKSHPNWNLYTDHDEAVCPACGSSHVNQDGHYYTSTGKYDTFKCMECGAVSRKRKSVLPKKKEILVSIPGR